MIYLGIDDTDTLDTPGTNQLARAIVAAVHAEYEPVSIVRHQLFFDPRVPYTSKNGSASVLLQPRQNANLPELINHVRAIMRAWFKEGSDPGLCVAEHVPPAITAFGQRCQRELIDQEEARGLAAEHGLHLEGLGGTEGGVIGALAAVGLIATRNDGRVVQLGTWPDDLAGPQELATLHARAVAVRQMETEALVIAGRVEVGKHLRPNLRDGQVVVYVTRASQPEVEWQAVRLV